MAQRTNLAIKTGGIIVLFGVSLLFFLNYFQGRVKEQQPTLPSLIGKTIPVSHLVNLSGTELGTQELRRGKVILVLLTPDCASCLEEGEFLRASVNKRSDVRFYGAIPFGNREDALKSAEGKFPFQVFFDEGALLSRELSTKGIVPVKLYLEDGIIKKTWIGSTKYYHTESEFNQWLGSLR
jgi:hypothetical protein